MLFDVLDCCVKFRSFVQFALVMFDLFCMLFDCLSCVCIVEWSLTFVQLLSPVSCSLMLYDCLPLSCDVL